MDASRLVLTEALQAHRAACGWCRNPVTRWCHDGQVLAALDAGALEPERFISQSHTLSAAGHGPGRAGGGAPTTAPGPMTRPAVHGPSSQARRVSDAPPLRVLEGGDAVARDERRWLSAVLRNLLAICADCSADMHWPIFHQRHPVGIFADGLEQMRARQLAGEALVDAAQAELAKVSDPA